MTKEQNSKQRSRAQNLDIQNLSVSIEGKIVVNNISFILPAGELHVIMGPNGSGKTSLVKAIAGHPDYKLKTQNSKLKSKIAKIILNNKNITEYSPEERVRNGLMLAFQNPVAIPGVSISKLLRTAYQEIKRKRKDKKSTLEFYEFLNQKAKILSLDESFLKRSVNDGFSGGEKKKAEMLQLLVLKPRFAILDEIDTGLDVDALKSVASGVSQLKKSGTGILLITHYQRILQYLDVDYVHIMKKGQFVKEGGRQLIELIEKQGYAEI